MHWKNNIYTGFLLLTILAPPAWAAAKANPVRLVRVSVPPPARAIHVAKTGKDSNPGDAARPYRTVQKAAESAMPGDRILVHAGIYREQVSPARGGISEQQRIVYQAAPGERVSIRGSERIISWKRMAPGVWEAEVPDERFGNFNPFATVVRSAGAIPARVGSDGEGHLGAVYLDERPLAEASNEAQVNAKTGTWYAQPEKGITRIRANFGNADPNRRMAEINVRASAFAVAKAGIDYISFEGFSVGQTAAPAASMDGEQPGAIATGGGTHWVIRHNTITDAKCVAISIGQTGHPYTESRPNHPAYSDLTTNIDSVGHHLLSGNHIRRCGQAGIFGLLHGTSSRIDSNRIEDINADGRMSDLEPAAIRLAVAVDAVISDNFIDGRAGACGICLGPLYQGARVTGNVIKAAGQSCLYLYESHGPLLVDNNILHGSGAAGKAVKMAGAEAGLFVQNTFYDCGFINDTLPRRPWAVSNFLPHSLVIKQTIPVLPFESKWIGNRCIRGGLGQLLRKPGMVMEFNEDKEGKMPIAGCPRIDADFIGIIPLSKESIEEPDGRPLVAGGGSAIAAAAKEAGYTAWPVNRVSPSSHPQAFLHPGLLHTKADLERMKDAVAGGLEPWKSGFAIFAADAGSSAAYIPHPFAHVERSLLAGAGKNIGSLERDGNAAYQNALMWCITGEEAHAKKAIEILNGWSSTLKVFDGTDIELGAGINGLKFANAAELMRATYPGWPVEDIRRCQSMLLHIFYPPLQYFALWAHGNWDLACMKSMIAIGIFCDDHALFDRAVDFFYHGPGNGSILHYVVNAAGQVQESGRDQGHTQLGIGQLAEVCQMAWNQGLDLYGAYDSRLLSGFEYVARYNLGEDVPFEPYADQSGRFPASHISDNGRGKLRSIYEMVLNHYQQAGLPVGRMKYTRMAAEKLRPEGPGFGADHPGFGTLFFSLKPL